MKAKLEEIEKQLTKAILEEEEERRRSRAQLEVAEQLKLNSVFTICLCLFLDQRKFPQRSERAKSVDLHPIESSLKPAFKAFDMQGLINRIKRSVIVPLLRDILLLCVLLKSMLRKNLGLRPSASDHLRELLLQPYVQKVLLKLSSREPEILPSESARRGSYPEQERSSSGKSVIFGPTKFGIDHEDSICSVKPAHTYFTRRRPVDLSANKNGVIVRRTAVSTLSNSSRYVSVRSNQHKSSGLRPATSIRSLLDVLDGEMHSMALGFLYY